MKEFFKPKSIAVIGASADPHKIGYTVFDNLISSFSGKVFGVNPKRDQILGEKIYPTILDVPGKIDVAVVCVPEPLVIKVIESCGKKGVKYAIIISSGFSEVGSSGKEKEQEVLKAAKKFGVRVLGPNCLGIINNYEKLNATFAGAKLPGHFQVGIFSQSGAMGSAILDFANGNNFGFSYFVSLGNKSDISEIDLLKAWEDDDNVKVAVGYLESIREGEEFLKVAKSFTEKKPLIILKGGMTKQGEKAAKLHTAAMAQDENVFKAAMNDAGVILAQNLNDLFELAISFSVNGLPKGKRLAIVSNAGGPSVLAADAVAREKVELASLSPHTINELSKKTEAASIENPIDLRGDAKKDDFRLALDLCEKDKNVDGILLIVTPQSMTEIEGIVWAAVMAKKEGKKPIYVNLIGGELIERAKEICQESGLPIFTYPERAVRAFAFQAAFEKRIIEKSKKPQKHAKHSVAKSIINFNRNNLSESRLSSLLGLYDIPMAKTILAKTKEEAAEALKTIKTPVVMKISSPEILHKTDVGGVVLGVTNEKEATAAFEKIISNAKKNVPEAKLNGVIVMEMAKEGLELIVGAKKDPCFGPVLMFGYGGILVELISDFSIITAPFTYEKVKRMIEDTTVSRIINGYRTGKKYDEVGLIKAVLAVGQLISDHPEINSLEINPLVLNEKEGALGLDAKIEVSRVS